VSDPIRATHLVPKVPYAQRPSCCPGRARCRAIAPLPGDPVRHAAHNAALSQLGKLRDPQISSDETRVLYTRRQIDKMDEPVGTRRSIFDECLRDDVRWRQLTRWTGYR